MRRDFGVRDRDETRDFIFICPEIGTEIIFFFDHSNSNFRLIAGSYGHIHYLNDSKIASEIMARTWTGHF